MAVHVNFHTQNLQMPTSSIIILEKIPILKLEFQRTQSLQHVHIEHAFSEYCMCSDTVRNCWHSALHALSSMSTESHAPPDPSYPEARAHMCKQRKKVVLDLNEVNRQLTITFMMSKCKRKVPLALFLFFFWMRRCQTPDILCI